MDALHAIRHRRAVRRYTDRPVPEEDVAGLMRLALHAPTGHGAQALYFRTFRPPAEGVTDEEHAEWARAYAEEVLGTYRQVPVWICALTVPALAPYRPDSATQRASAVSFR